MARGQDMHRLELHKEAEDEWDFPQLESECDDEPREVTVKPCEDDGD
jgi:hypothetical protein